MTNVYMMKNLRHYFQAFTHKRYALGLEILDQSIKIVEIDLRSKPVPMLTQCIVEKLPRDVMEDGKIKDQTRLIRVIQSLVSKHDLKARTVHFVVPSQSAMVRFLKFPNVSLKDLRKVIDFEVSHNIHLPFEQPIYDFIKVNGDGSLPSIVKKPKKKRKKQDQDLLEEPEELTEVTAKSFLEAAASTEGGINNLFKEEAASPSGEVASAECDVILIAAPKELIDDYTEVMKSAGLIPRSIELKVFSLYRLISKLPARKRDGTFLVVDINDTLSDLSVFQDNQLKLTRSVLVAFGKANHDSADKPNEEAPSALFAEFDNPQADLQLACSDLGNELERLINFYRYTLNNRSEEFQRIMLSGDSPDMQHIADYLQGRLSLPVKLLDDDVFKIGQSVEIDLNRFAVPFGLALRGYQR